jgi:pilus assembly protein Flp/PilA
MCELGCRATAFTDGAILQSGKPLRFGATGRKGAIMQAFLSRAKAFLESEDGPTATEYAVMLALVLMVVIGGVTLLGTKVNDMFTNADSQLDPGTPGPFGGGAT